MPDVLNVLHDALLKAYENPGEDGYFYSMAAAALDALRSLPVEERMTAMGMERWCPEEQVVEPVYCECVLWVEADA